MPYVKRTVRCGRITEIKKMYTGRVHTAGASRGAVSGSLTERQRRCNDRRRADTLRWLINANFGDGDLHITLHYYDKSVTLEQAEADRKAFLAVLKKRMIKTDMPWKYVAVTETKRMTNVHHHILLLPVELTVLTSVWREVLGDRGGNVSVKPLDDRADHRKLAKYLLKESKSTAKRWVEAGKPRYKRYTAAQGMVRPTPEYEIVMAGNWAKEPRAPKGWALLKDEDSGEFVRQGIHDVTGYAWQEYTLINTDGTYKEVRRKIGRHNKGGRGRSNREPGAAAAV